MDGSFCSALDAGSLIATLSLMSPKPGDVLLLKIPRNVPTELARQAMHAVGAVLPAGVCLLALPEGADLLIPDPAELVALLDRPAVVH